MATRLKGKDGKVSTGTLGTAIDGDGSTPLAEGFYVAGTILSSGSGLPTGLQTDYTFKADSTITPETGESVKLFTLTDQCDIVSVTLTSAGEEIDMTTLCDDEKVYDVGFDDFTGSLEGITTVDVSEDFLNRAFDIVDQANDLASVTITDKNNDTLYLRTELKQENSDSVPQLFFMAPIKITQLEQGVAVEGRQTFSAQFRITKDDDVKPCLYKLQAS